MIATLAVVLCALAIALLGSVAATIDERSFFDYGRES